MEVQLLPLQLTAGMNMNNRMVADVAGCTILLWPGGPGYGAVCTRVLGAMLHDWDAQCTNQQVLLSGTGK